MGFQASLQTYKAPQSSGPVSIAPYYGMSTLETATEAMVLGLTGRGPLPGFIDTTFHLTATPGSGLFQYFAYPVSYGPARFLDTDSGFYGAWDGANNDPDNVWGPITIDVTVGATQVPFYVYRTDMAELGSCNWVASVDPA